MAGWVVITSIFPPTKAIEKVAQMCEEQNWRAVVVGDRKTPSSWEMGSIDFLSVEEQNARFGRLSELIPLNHYCRKNLGYLYAISKGAEFILETDDDNIPLPCFGRNISKRIQGRHVNAHDWVNVYRYFTDDNVWPRGLPLDKIQGTLPEPVMSAASDCPIQQYLVDGDPDVDAVYRLTVAKPVTFDPSATPVLLAKGTWAPFNTQNTLFYEDMFPLLYVPCHVSFRVTDIWRSLVAQAALWVKGYKLAFLTSTVRQERNVHNLMKDFQDEVLGYIENKRIADVLEKHVSAMSSTTSPSAAETSLRLWKVMAKEGWIPESEIEIIQHWLKHLSVVNT